MSADESLTRPVSPSESLIGAASSGTMIGPYRLGAFLGDGGMGRVYRATDTRLGRAVAIKFVADQFSDHATREARAIAALNHLPVPGEISQLAVSPDRRHFALVHRVADNDLVELRFATAPSE